MKGILAVLALVLAHAGLVSGQALPQKAKQIGSAEDDAAIRDIVSHWQRNWDKFDASVLKEDYAQDADWQNAFGVRKKGSAEILAFVGGVVKRPQNQDRHTTWGTPQVRFVRPDIAIAYRDYQTGGNKAPDGSDLPERHTHSTWILAKDGGKWRIVSQVISDDNGR